MQGCDLWRRQATHVSVLKFRRCATEGLLAFAQPHSILDLHGDFQNQLTYFVETRKATFSGSNVVEEEESYRPKKPTRAGLGTCISVSHPAQL